MAVREGGGDTLIYIIGTVEELGGRARIYNVFNFECVTKLQSANKTNERERERLSW